MTYTPMDGLPDYRIAKAVEIHDLIIGYMRKHIVEQIAAGATHPYADGKFEISHSKEGEMYVAQLNFNPNDDGSVQKPKIVEKEKSKLDVVDSLQVLLHYIDPTRLEYRNKKW